MEKTDAAPTLAIVPQMPAADGICYSMEAPQLSKSSSRKPSRKASKSERSSVNLNYCMESVSVSACEMDEEPEEWPYLYKPLDADTRLELAQLIDDFVDTNEDVRKLIDLLGDIRTLSLEELLNAITQLAQDEPAFLEVFLRHRSFVPHSGRERDDSLGQLLFVFFLVSALNVVHGNSSELSEAFDDWIERLEVKDVQDFKEKLGL